jgi:hypothetical protein
MPYEILEERKKTVIYTYRYVSTASDKKLWCDAIRMTFCGWLFSCRKE